MEISSITYPLALIIVAYFAYRKPAGRKSNDSEIWQALKRLEEKTMPALAQQKYTIDCLSEKESGTAETIKQLAQTLANVAVRLEQNQKITTNLALAQGFNPEKL